MGEIVSLGDSIIITVFSMVVVFVGLIVLAFIISVLKNIGSEKDKEVVKKEIVKKEEKASKPIEEVIDDNIENEEELIAVIAASIAASLGVSIPEVNIKSIRRIPQNTPTWAQAGRHERIYGKL